MHWHPKPSLEAGLCAELLDPVSGTLTTRPGFPNSAIDSQAQENWLRRLTEATVEANYYQLDYAEVKEFDELEEQNCLHT